MEKFLIGFFWNEKYISYSLETVMLSLRNHRISRRLINAKQELKFPVVESDGKYWIRNDIVRDQKKVSGSEDRQELKHGDYFSITDGESSYQFVVWEKSRISVNMKKISLPAQGTVVIGRSKTADLVLNMNGSISREHAEIRIVAGQAVLEDRSGKAGVYVNYRKADRCSLVCGDQITIMGYTIVYLKDFLMIPETVEVNHLTRVIYYEKIKERQPVERITIERTPRIYKSLITEELKVDPPTPHQEQKQQPFILAAGPSLTMSLAMMLQVGMMISKVQETGNYASVIGSGAMAASLLCGAIVWPYLSRKYYKKEEKEAEEYRQKRYASYLNKKEEVLHRQQEYNKWVWNTEYYPSMEELVGYIVSQSNRVWEKAPEDQDFLHVRLGVGEKFSEIPVNIPEEHFTLYDDEMLERTFQFAKNHRKVSEVPIDLSLREKKIIGIVGENERIRNLIWCMVTGISVMHSPDEVKIGLIGEAGQFLDFEWMLQLPHVWSQDGKIRFTASNVEEVQHLLLYLEEETKNRTTEALYLPYYVIFVLDEKLMESSPLGVSARIKEQFRGVTVVYAAELFSRIPKETEAIILEDADQTGVYKKNEDDNQFTRFHPDELTYPQIQKMMKHFVLLQPQIEGMKKGIPDRVPFLSMFRVGNVTTLNIAKRWKESRVSTSLAAPIGVKTDGELFYLDIHEKYHGCHGLVAGMTGSGKSEFLQEYIVSLMLNYSPEDVAFILIDFKGGDMARPFLKSPHLAATISNLSGNMLYRARVSLEAEIQKRQNLFNETAQELQVDKLDINSWHKYVADGRIKKKLPHLIIIIDEFAQLKTQQPEFLEYLVNVAQVGRSLGIHLILATQKPNGVVSPQIWSNSRFRVCLKVLDGEDSKEMIRRADAASIKFPGRAYVQVGYDEIFEQVQTGYSGADYVENKKYVEEGEDSVELLEYTAESVRSAKKRLNGKKTGKTQLEETVSEIIRVADRLHLKTEALWKPTLEKRIFLQDCTENLCQFEQEKWDSDREGTAICGLCDLPQIQQQIPYEINFIEEGHVAVYGMSGTGKTVFLQTVAFSLALKYSPELFRLYAIDFGGRNLGNLKEMPHCAAVAFEDEKEKITRVIREVKLQMERRKKLFAERECNTYESYIQITKQKLPMIFLMIDNYGVFRERMYQLEDAVTELAANASTYGIYLVITGNSRNAIYYKIAEHIGTRVVFQMNDGQIYRELLNSRFQLEPEDFRGRALVKYKDMVAEMQTALPFDTINEALMYSKMKQVYRKMNAVSEHSWIMEEKESQEEKESLEREEKLTEEIFLSDGRSGIGNDQIPYFDTETEGTWYLEVGSSLYDGRRQGISLEKERCIFIGSEKEQSYNALLQSLTTASDTNCFFFSLKEEAPEGWKRIQTEKEISEMIETRLEKGKEKILFISDFSDYYDTISDEDLRIFGKKIDEDQNLRVITAGVFKKLEDYRDTGLYVRLVKCTSGMIMQGGIDNQKVAMLCNALSKSDPAKRTAELGEKEAILYCGDKLSFVAVSWR